MDQILLALRDHGYSILCTIVLLETLGFPFPAALALLVAGAVLPVFTWPAALLTVLVGDSLMFLVGRYTGWWLLTMLCRLSLNPEGCILGAADSFYKRGRWVLVFAKFVPGINTMAAPLAGSMNMRYSQFLLFDLMGASLYTSTFWLTGYLFHDFLDSITGAYKSMGSIVGWLMAIGFAGYLVYHAIVWMRSRNLAPVARVSVAEVARRAETMEILDVRSHGYYERGATRIPGSKRLEPNALHQRKLNLPPDKEIVLYCTCFREETSTRVARILAEQGIQAAVIVGGFPAWKKAGLPLETVPGEELIELPTFA